MELESIYTNPFFPLFGLVGLGALALALYFYMDWKRRGDLKRLAASMGLAFSLDGPEIPSLEATGLEIFGLGRFRKASNLLQVQTRAGTISFFDYHYTVGSGRSTNTHALTLALLDCGGCEVPVFELKPESLLYKLGEAVGFKDIDLPAFPLFSDKYRLTGPDETKVHMFFTPQRAAWFERNLGLRVQGAPGYMVIFKREDLLPVNAWQGFMEEAKVFAAEVLP